MEISKSTPYVRYRENISSSLHKGTVHIESEYLDRERKTSIESIEGQTWQNLAVNENKELEMLGVGSIGLSGDIYDTGEKRLAVDVVMGNATPTVNEDGTYTYSVSTMEGEYARTFDGVNHITSTSDGLDGEFHIKYNTQGEEIIGNFSMNGEESHVIEDSKNGAIKSAILKGQTLKNEYQFKTTSSATLNTTYNYNDNEYTVTSDGINDGYVKTDITVYLEANKNYTFKAKCNRGFDSNNGHIYLLLNNSASTGKKMTNENATFTVPTSGIYYVRLDVRASSEPYIFSDLMILEGDYTNVDIPYFTGMQSVKMPSVTTTGKNLFNNNYTIGKFIDEMGIDSDGANTQCALTEFMPIKGGANVKFSNSITLHGVMIFEYDVNKKFLAKTWADQLRKTQDNTRYYRYSATLIGTGSSSEEALKVMMMEYGTQATPYEPYQSNILTAPNDVVLRGIGDVKDTLDCLTGEVTERIGEIMLDGSEDWIRQGVSQNNSNLAIYYSPKALPNTIFNTNNVLCDKFKTSKTMTWHSSEEDIYVSTSTYGLKICFDERKLESATVGGFKKWLSENTPTIQYPLVEKPVKTVDLIIKDQDGKTSRQLSTYEGATHVNVSSDGLIPLADISYKMHSTTDVVSGTSVTIEDGKDSDMVEGVVYGNSLVNVFSYAPEEMAQFAWNKKDATGVAMWGSSGYVTKWWARLQANKTYTMIYVNAPSHYTGFYLTGTFTDGYSQTQGKYSVFTVKSDFVESDVKPNFYLNSSQGFTDEELANIQIVILEGDYTDQDIPYFEGIGSVENPLVTVCGRNLFNPSKHTSISYDGLLYTCQLVSKDEGAYYHLEPNTEYRIKVTSDTPKVWFQIQSNGNFNNGAANNYLRFTTDDTGKTFIKFGGNSEVGRCRNIYMSKVEDFIGENFTLPPIHASLSTTPQITLHGIGDVKDEWDMVNETVTRRVGTATFNGSENWEVHNYGYKIDTKYLNLKHNTPSDTVATNFMCDRIPTSSINDLRDRGVDAIAPTNENDTKILVYVSSVGKDNLNGFKQWLSKNPITVLYELATPTTEPVLITPQNPKTSTASITIDEPLNTQDAIHDKLRWNPYKGCYVRYNHIVDGVSYDQHRTIENLYDLGERQYVDLYEHRTYFLPTNGSMESRTHGTSVYCLAEQGKQYCVRWDWIESPTVDTIKVDLCGNIKEIPSTENSVVIDVANMKHSFVQLQGNGLQGRFTNLMVIETIDGEIPDVDFFSGVKAIGSTVQIDGATKVQIDVEQTNGNLFDIEPVIFNNGNYISYCWNENNRGMPIKNGKTYTFKHLKRQDGEWGDYSLRTFDENLKLIRTISIISGAKIREHSFTAQYNEKYIRGYGQMILNGSTHTHYPVELCYTDMIKDGIRPRHHDMKSFILPMKLCRVGEVYDELYYDDLKGYYRIQQSIGHKYFTGDTSERWEMGVINLNSRTVAFTYKNGDINQLAMGDTICNGFKRLKDVNQDTEGFIIYNGDFVLRIDKERIEGNCSIDGLRAYLTSYPIHLFYQLKTPQMVDLPQYPNRLELNTYRDEVFTFIKDSNPTKFTLSIPMDRTYRFDDHQEGQGLANRVSITDERISSENVVAIQEIRGKGIANLIEDPNNVPVTPLPNYSGVATSHQLTNTKPSIVHVHGFEPSGDTKIGTWNVADKKYQIKVMSGNSNYSLSDYYALDVPYQLETYPDGTKDRVYYNVERQEWQVNGSYDRTIAFNASTGAFTEAVEIFRGMTPRSGMIAEFKLRFTSGTTTARLYYSVNGSTYSYVTLRGMVDDQDYYLAFFNTGGTKIDYSTKVGATTEYASMTALSATIPEGLFVNQIQSLTECTHYVDKFYQYPTLHTPIELDTYDGTTNIYIDGKTTDTNIIINNDCFQKVVNTYEDVEYTVYWKYLSGDGKLTITLGGTKVEVDGTKEYATIRTQLQAPQELVYIGGYNLSIQDVMVIKGARIDGLAYFEGSRQVGTLVVDEHGNKQYKITLVQGGSVLEQKDYDKVEFKDDNKHNVVVHKIVGVRPTKVD